MKKGRLRKFLSASCASLLSAALGLGCIPFVEPAPAEIRADAAVTASSNGYVAGKTYSHDSRFDGYSIVDGIDVSVYQKTIDWNKVKADGIDYAFIRVGFRGYGAGSLNEDGKYKQNLTNAPKAGVKTGVYIYSQAITVEEAVEEAEYILSRIKDYDVTLPVVLDYEYAGTGVGRLYNAHLSRREATDICAAFCDTVIEAGYTPMVYANKNMFEKQLYAKELSQKYEIWLAHYTGKTNYSGDYQYWQYSSRGKIDGITSGTVDCNFFYTKDESYKDIRITHQSAEPADIDAKITLNIQNPGGGIVSQAGFHLYDAAGNQIGSHFDTCGYSSDRVTYTGRVSDYGAVLQPKTRYFYEPFAKVGGKFYYGQKKSFETTLPTVNLKTSVKPSEHAAVLTVNVDNHAQTLVQQLICKVYDSNGIQIGTVENFCNTTEKNPVVTMVISAETGVPLQANSRYSYTVSAVHDGLVETTKRSDFQTPVSHTAETLQLAPTYLSFNGETTEAALRVSWTPADAEPTVRWSSSNDKIASVDQKGNVKAVGIGYAVITASASGKTASCEVWVNSLPMDLSLTETSLGLFPGDVKQLHANLAGGSSFEPLHWVSSNSAVASVTEDGRLTALKSGETVIRCSVLSNPAVYAECRVTVSPSFRYHLNGGTNAKENPVDAARGTAVSLQAPKRAGYTFGGWYTDSAFRNRVSSVTASDKTIDLYAKWEETVELTAPSIKKFYTKFGGKLYIYLDKPVENAEGYQYVYSTSPKFTTHQHINSTSLRGRVDVKFHQKYYVKVRAIATDGNGKRIYGPYSEARAVVTACSVPDRLSAVTAASSGHGDITVSVARPVADCYGYQYVIAKDSAFKVDKQYVGTRKRSHTFENLAAGTYYVRGRTYNKDEVTGYVYSFYTPTIKVTVKSDYPEALTGVQLSSSAPDSITAQAEMHSASDYYRFAIADNPEFKDAVYKTTRKTAYTFTGLKEGTYYIKARALNKVNGKYLYSPYTAAVRFELAEEELPEPLTGVEAVSEEKGSLHVKVARPVLSCYGYQYQIAVSEDFANPITVDTRLRYHDFTELPKGTYYVRGRTYNLRKNGTGNIYGEFCEAVSVAVESDIPESLTGVTAEKAGAGQIKIAVAAPVLSCYGYQYELSADPDFTKPVTADTRNRSYVFDRLDAGTYYLRGRTYDLKGDSDEKIYGVFCPVISFTLK